VLWWFQNEARGLLVSDILVSKRISLNRNTFLAALIWSMRRVMFTNRDSRNGNGVTIGSTLTMWPRACWPFSRYPPLRVGQGEFLSRYFYNSPLIYCIHLKLQIAVRFNRFEWGKRRSNTQLPSDRSCLLYNLHHYYCLLHGEHIRRFRYCHLSKRGWTGIQKLWSG